MEHSRLTMDMAGGRFPCGSFGENTAWWLSIISLNLLKLFQRTALPVQYRTVGTKKLHTIFFRIALKIMKQSRSLAIKVEESQKELYEMMVLARKKVLHIGEILLNRIPAPDGLPILDSS